MYLRNKLLSVIMPITLLMGTTPLAAQATTPELETVQEQFDEVLVDQDVIITDTPNEEPAAEEVAPEIRPLPYTKDDLFCLAKNIYHEARGESIYGQRAVAQVTLNRVKSPKFRNTICGVVHEPNQFSWANNRAKRWSIPSGKAWTEAQQLAEEVLLAGTAVEGMDGVLFFHSKAISPGWRNMRRFAVIGNHVFYRRA